MDGNFGELKARVLDATNIVDLIARSVQLQKRGKDFVGLCPFHQEKTPSFHVSQAKQFYYCYGCKKHGNAIDFVIDRDRLEFKDALRQLAQAAGIELPKLSNGENGSNRGEMQLLRDAHSAACLFFEKQLADSAIGGAAGQYLQDRGFSAQTLSRFRVGFAPSGWDHLLSSLGRKFAPGLLALAGLVKPRPQGPGHYDVFRNRVMFPIRDAQGSIIAFGGRVMPGSEDPAKYLNSPQTPLFDKGRCLFGLDLGKEKILSTRTVAIVEGYTDVVMAHQFGCTNVVSTLGTALTPRHLATLSRYADRIVLLFDPDTAGDVAVNRAVELFLTQDKLDIVVAQLPDGLDPDEFLLKHGAAAFDAVLSQAADALTYQWKSLMRRFAGAGDVSGRQKAVHEYLAMLAAARETGPVDALRWGETLTRVSRLTGILTADLHRRFKVSRPKRTQAAQRVVPKTEILTAEDRAEGFVLGHLLCEPGQWVSIQTHVDPSDFTDGARRELAEIYWRRQRDEGEPILSEFLDVLENPVLKQLAAQLAHEARVQSEPETSLKSGLEFLKMRRSRLGHQACEARLRSGDANEAEQVALLEQISKVVADPDPRRLAVPYGA